MILLNSSLTRALFHWCWYRFCVHSKYEPTTPPALTRMSGSTWMPRSTRTDAGLYARGVAGVYHSVDGRGGQELTVELKKLVVADGVAAAESGNVVKGAGLGCWRIHRHRPPPRSVAAGFLAPSRACCNAAIIGTRWQPFVYTLGAYSGDRSSGATCRLEPLLR